MLKWIESTGKSEEAAIEAALQKLGMDRDEVSVEILERAKSGFLGIGSCPAKVKVSYEAPDEPEERPAPAEVTPAEAELVKAAEPAVREEAPSPAAPVAEGEKAERIDAFLTGLLAQMGTEARPVIRVDENGTYQVELVGRELGGLIGRRGEDPGRHPAAHRLRRQPRPVQAGPYSCGRRGLPGQAGGVPGPPGPEGGR